MGRVSGKVVFITGAGSGMGRAHALRLAGEGATVAISDRDEAGLSETLIALKAIGAEAGSWAHDVTDEHAWQRVVDEACARFGRIDVVINNAGIAHTGSVLDTTVEDWDRVMAINLRGVFLGVRTVGTKMRDQGGGGSIINISSVFGMVGGAMASAYCASKGGVRLLTKAAAADLAEFNIRVNSVHPGLIDTPMLGGLLAEDGEVRQRMLSVQLQRRAADPDEVSSVVLFLASDESSFVTGSELVVDGGWSAR
ncbi:MAG: SDR family NAD(P)-dependent oxidoreductase [Immundisolibacter sp.]|uniref:SDR family NAD(P)-dependent oxidoreductase n=1 Tax=Immundisolibacter sp. TaxID=1934948 RepID=UPI003EDE957C